MRPLRRLVLALCLSLAAMPAAAAPTFDISKLAVGTVVHWRADNGNTAITYLGPDERGGYRLAFQRDASQHHPLAMTWWVTRDG